MKNHFYSHLIEIDSLTQELSALNLKKHEQNELLSIVRVHVHHVAVDTILSELSEDQKTNFLNHLQNGKHDKTWRHINNHIDNAEVKIKKAVDKLLLELRGDIKDSIKEQSKDSKHNKSK